MALQRGLVKKINILPHLYEDMADILKRKISGQLKFHTHGEIWRGKNTNMEEFYKVAKVSETPPGTKKLVEVDFVPVLLFNVQGEFYAIEDVCTHDDGPLAEGWFSGDEIECPRHGARFCVKTGKALCMPAVEDVECYTVKLEGDDILISVD